MELTQKGFKVGLKAVLKILEKWGCNENQILVLLCFKNKDDISAVNQQDLNQDQVIRISYILNIHGGLRQVFSNPDNVYGFMTMKNQHLLFNGHTPLSLLLEGEHSDFEAVMNHVLNLGNF
ncbi:hypothetical protein AB4160_13150 [Shewanella sp. 10N.286.51.B8]|uniref:antitoxin Xre/MbcA/ParS toxin-binding domain-containing protein n=1 Tax=Shewanella sp. 10N.286.51.B8 TaxID=3229708 RepID=UPI0035508F1C